MSRHEWTKPELKKLRQLYDAKPDWITDYRFSAQVAEQFKRSPESVRWQLRQFDRTVNATAALRPPKILLLDIETLPIEALVWDVWKQNIYMEQIKKDWSVLCYAAKWLFDAEVMGNVVSPEEAVNHRDDSILPEIWHLMNEADWIIWHNGKDFDAKKLNARFFVRGMPKPMYYQSIDTKAIAKEELGLTYNKLDWIASILGVGRKIETEFSWWKECEAGNKEYLAKMLEYNKMDTHLEEEVYLRLRPWMTKHPNMNLYANHVGNVCPTCGEPGLNWHGQYATALGLYRAFRCGRCGAIGRSTKKQYKLSQSEVSN